MAGPNRPDESPKDFSFLNKDGAVPDRPSFPSLDDASPTSLPEIDVDTSPAPADLSGIVADPISFPPSTPSAATDDEPTDNQSADDQTVMMAAPDSPEAPERPEVSTEPLTPEAVADRIIVESESPVEKKSSVINGYAIAITLLMIFCLMTGRLKLFGNAALESLPDIRPLDSNEFRKVPDGTPVPEGHVLKLGESRRFGDVVLTPVKVTREPLMFEQFQTKAPATTLTTDPVLKLWLRFENRSGSYAFPPFDSGLMSHRTPRFSTDESTIVNSMLNVSSANSTSPVRVLNFLQTLDNAFVIVGQQSGKVIFPEETLETFIASSEDIQYITATPETGYTWRVQFRKGVHESSGHGVTTLVDVLFSEADISDATPPAVPATTPTAG